MSARGLIPVALAVGLGIANGQQQTIIRSSLHEADIQSFRLRYFQSSIPRARGREDAQTEVL
jgi:hypothetical protein